MYLLTNCIWDEFETIMYIHYGSNVHAMIMHIHFDVDSIKPDKFLVCNGTQIDFHDLEICTHIYTVLWRHNDGDGVSNHQPHDCLLNCLFRRRPKKTSKLRVTGLYAGYSPGTGEFPAQMASNAENVSIWWRHHE